MNITKMLPLIASFFTFLIASCMQFPPWIFIAPLSFVFHFACTVSLLLKSVLSIGIISFLLSMSPFIILNLLLSSSPEATPVLLCSDLLQEMNLKLQQRKAGAISMFSPASLVFWIRSWAELPRVLYWFQWPVLSDKCRAHSLSRY